MPWVLGRAWSKVCDEEGGGVKPRAAGRAEQRTWPGPGGAWGPAALLSSTFSHLHIKEGGHQIVGLPTKQRKARGKGRHVSHASTAPALT